MVQFLSINFFSWISSNFVGVFKCSLFFCITLYFAKVQHLRGGGTSISCCRTKSERAQNAHAGNTYMVYLRTVVGTRCLSRIISDLILRSFDLSAAFHLELLQTILFIALYLSAPVFLSTCFNPLALEMDI